MSFRKRLFLFATAGAIVFSPIAIAQQEAAPPAPPAASSEAAAKVIAKVGDLVVTEQDVQQASARAARMSGHSGGANQIDRNRIIETCIDAKILEYIVKNSGITISDEEIDKFAEDTEKRRPGSGTFDDFLKRQNLTREQYRERARPNLLLARFLEPKLRDLAPNKEEIQKEYENLKTAGQMVKPEMVDASHLLVKVAPGADEKTWDDAKARVEKARKRIVEGKEEFSVVAKEISDDPSASRTGGSLQGIRKGVVPPEFEKVVFETPVGEVSQPFRASYGWQFVQVTAKHAAGTLTIEEAGPMISEVMMRKRKDDLVRKLIADERAKIKIERLDGGEVAPAAPAPGAETPAPAPATEQPAPAAGGDALLKEST